MTLSRRKSTTGSLLGIDHRMNKQALALTIYDLNETTFAPRRAVANVLSAYRMDLGVADLSLEGEPEHEFVYQPKANGKLRPGSNLSLAAIYQYNELALELWPIVHPALPSAPGVHCNWGRRPRSQLKKLASTGLFEADDWRRSRRFLGALHAKHGPHLLCADIQSCFEMIRGEQVKIVLDNLGVPASLIDRATVYAELTGRGLPQGPSLSWLLAPLVVSPILIEFARYGIPVVAFMDDFAIPCDSRWTGGRYLAQLTEMCEQRGFLINPAKWRIYDGLNAQFAAMGVEPGDVEMENYVVEDSEEHEDQEPERDQSYSVVGKSGVLPCSIDWSRLHDDLRARGPDVGTEKLFRQTIRETAKIDRSKIVGDVPWFASGYPSLLPTAIKAVINPELSGWAHKLVKAPSSSEWTRAEVLRRHRHWSSRPPGQAAMSVLQTEGAASHLVSTAYEVAIASGSEQAAYACLYRLQQEVRMDCRVGAASGLAALKPSAAQHARALLTREPKLVRCAADLAVRTAQRIHDQAA